MPYDFINGALLLIDKPLDWTSFDVVNKIRFMLKSHVGARLKVGHAGTLDPKASGLLLICTGSMTKQINRFMDLDKEYTGTFIIGAVTPSYDTETEITGKREIGNVKSEMILAAAQNLTGDILQIPPLYSAKKIEGKRAYEFARKDHKMELPAVAVSISAFEITRVALPEVDFRISCSKGTYIRALARDFGAALGTGAYLSALRRTRIGGYNVKDAMSIEQFAGILGSSSR
jgi:tRNA pseudouridine55 synthase